jgi:hypothetical protein
VKCSTGPSDVVTISAPVVELSTKSVPFAISTVKIAPPATMGGPAQKFGPSQREVKVGFASLNREGVLALVIAPVVVGLVGAHEDASVVVVVEYVYLVDISETVTDVAAVESVEDTGVVDVPDTMVEFPRELTMLSFEGGSHSTHGRA